MKSICLTIIILLLPLNIVLAEPVDPYEAQINELFQRMVELKRDGKRATCAIYDSKIVCKNKVPTSIFDQSYCGTPKNPCSSGVNKLKEVFLELQNQE